jgi:SAM-dependent methyltransferase
MSSDLETYYKRYYKDTPAGQMYTMEAKGHPSRLLTFQDWLREKVPAGGKVLDIGCGDMHFATMMPEYDWVGIDFNTDKAKGRAVVQDIMKPPYPFEAGSFDAIVCSEVLEHVWDIKVVHREARRLLKKEGVYIISTPNFQWIDHFLSHFEQLITDDTKTWTVEHIRHYTPTTHTRFLNESGFGVNKIAGADPQYSGVMAHASKVLFENLQARAPGLLDLGRVEQLVGFMFPSISHTVILEASKV